MKIKFRLSVCVTEYSKTILGPLFHNIIDHVCNAVQLQSVNMSGELFEDSGYIVLLISE
jgi:hypothetical protein